MREIGNMRLIISCGGTGGHFNPGLGIAKELLSRGGRATLLLGGKHAPAQMETAKKNQVPAVSFSFTRPGKNPATLAGFLLSVLRGFRQTRQLIREEKPDAMLVMGSSVSLPAVLAARSMRLPVFLHEGNAKIGKANRILSRFAEAIALSFPVVNRNDLRCPDVLTGFPLRKALTDSHLTKAEATEKINRLFHVSFSPDKPVLLVFGGSLGAKSINENFDADPADPLVRDLQVIHLAGTGKAETIRDKYRNFPCPVLLLDGTQEMDAVYAMSDAVICRAGGSTVSELAFFGKYSLLIPYPFAAELHQDDNARWLASGGGAEILPDSECSPDRFREFVSRFLAGREEYLRKGLASKTLASPDAAEKVLRMIADRIG